MDQSAEQPSRAELEERVQQAMRGVVQARGDLSVARDRRDTAVADLRIAGATVKEVHDLTGLSVGLISMIDTKKGVVTERTVTRAEE